jgi:hypothetical protein
MQAASTASRPTLTARHDASGPIDANVRIDRLLIPLASLKNPCSMTPAASGRLWSWTCQPY